MRVGLLAGQESDPHRKDVYIKLAGVEERHTQMWEKLLAEHGHPVAAQPRPSFNARLRAWFGRRFGPGYLLPLLLREEGQEVKGYMDLHKESRLDDARFLVEDRKSTRLNSSHGYISYAVFCLKKKKILDAVHRGTLDRKILPLFPEFVARSGVHAGS